MREYQPDGARQSSDSYHRYMRDDLDSWPRALSRRLFGTDFRPRALFHLLAHLPEEPRILDVGCGTGAMLNRVGEVRPDAELHGTDIAPTKHLEYEGTFYEANVLEGHDIPVGYFDLVYSSMVIEHVSDSVAFVAAMAMLAKESGHLVVHTMNHRSLLVSFYNDPTHVRPYSVQALRRTATMAQLDIVRCVNERCWPILLLSPIYGLYKLLSRKKGVVPFFWEHLLAVQSVLVARVPETGVTDSPE